MTSPLLLGHSHHATGVYLILVLLVPLLSHVTRSPRHPSLSAVGNDNQHAQGAGTSHLAAYALRA